MSYDLIIAADERFSESTPVEPLIAALGRMPLMSANGDRGFALDDPPDRWMEIDLERVSEDGDNIEEPGEVTSEINCISLHIPYGYFRQETFRADYLPIALAIAGEVGWALQDQQTGQVWTPPKRRHWWRFW